MLNFGVDALDVDVFDFVWVDLEWKLRCFYAKLKVTIVTLNSKFYCE